MADIIAVIQHAEDCKWTLKNITKTIQWFTYSNIKHCPNCEQPIIGEEEIDG